MHVGLIPDGNRRWAIERGLSPWEGHAKGAEVMENCLKWTIEEGAEEISIYSLSTENLVKRPREELEALFGLYQEYFDKITRDEFIRRNSVRVRVLGRTYLLPEKVRLAVRRAMDATRNHTGAVVNFLMPYSGQNELVRAVQRALLSSSDDSPEALDPQKVLEGFLYVKRPVDLVIRTGGGKRLSNFLLYQTAYAELAVVDKYWPDFTREDLRRVIGEFKHRMRRKGK